MTWSAAGPFETERAALDAAQRWEVPYNPADAEGWRAAQRQAHGDRLREAIERTGTPVGWYDSRIMSWAGGWEVAITEVFAGLIERAYEAGLRDARTDRAAIDGLDQ